LAFIGLMALPGPDALGGGILFACTRGATISLGLGADSLATVEARYDAIRGRKRGARAGTLVAGSAVLVAVLSLTWA